MTKQELESLIKECIVETHFKKQLKVLVKESIDEIKEENQKTCEALIESLQTELTKVDSQYKLERNDAGVYEVRGCPAHQFQLRYLYEDKFDLTHIRNGSHRTRKVVADVKMLKEFFKEVFNKSGSYVSMAQNKVADNSKTKDGHELPAHKKIEVEEMTKDKKDYPTEPMRPVETFKRQSEHPKDGVKADYKYPKQKDKKLTVKQKVHRSSKKSH
jgi:hypothetical protein